MLLQLPSGWKSKTLKELNSGGITNINPGSYPDEVFEYYSIPAYQDGARPAEVHGQEILSSKLSIPEKCLLFGKLNPRVEKIWAVNSESSYRRLASTEWLPIVPVEQLDQEFGYFLLWSDWVLPVAKRLTSGSTPSRQRVEPNSFYQIEVPLPPLSEQRAIAKALLKVQCARMAQAELIASAQELKPTAMRTLFTRGLCGEVQKETEIGLIPESWRVTHVAELATIKGGKRMPKGVSLVNEDTGRPYIRVTDFSNHSVREKGLMYVPHGYEEVIRRYRISSQDVYISIAGSIGLVGQVPDSLDDANLTENAAKITMKKEDVLARYIMYALASQACQEQIQRVTSRNAQPKLALTRIEKLLVPFPPIEKEQREIVNILDAINNKIDLHRRKRAVLDDLFKTLLHKLMTGEIRAAFLDLPYTVKE